MRCKSYIKLISRQITPTFGLVARSKGTKNAQTENSCRANSVSIFNILTEIINLTNISVTNKLHNSDI